MAEQFPPSESNISESLFQELENEVKRTGHILEEAKKKKDASRRRYNEVTRAFYDAKNDYRQALKKYLNAKTRIDSFGLKSA